MSRTSLAPVAPVPYPAGLRGKLLRGYRAPEHLRTRLWTLSAFAGVCLYAWLVTLSCGLFRAQDPTSSSLSIGAWAVTVLGSLGVIGIGAISWAHHLFWHIWPSTSRVDETLTRSTRAISASFASYVACTLIARLTDVLHPAAVSSAWLGWDIIIPVVSLLVGFTFWRVNKSDS